MYDLYSFYQGLHSFQYILQNLPMSRTLQFKTIIFDLDGTLVNTLADIAVSMNRALEAQGFPTLPLEAYRGIVGWGIRRLAQSALPLPEQENHRLIDTVAMDATAFYAEQPLVHSKPYAGIPELLAELRRRKLKIAVLTNKPDTVARLVLDGLFPIGAFHAIHGDMPNAPRKPDPTSVWELLVELDSTPRNTILVGDSEIDLETAHASGCHAVAVSWGFRSRETLENASAEHIIDTPMELLDCLN
jgi:phosphoglycolate phosphatase